jgi:hypothetical protein
VDFAAPALRTPAESAENLVTGERVPLERLPGNQGRLWVSNLARESTIGFRLNMAKAESPSVAGPRLATDGSGWPVSATWAGMSKPLFEGDCAKFIAAEFTGSSQRSSIARLHGSADSRGRDAIRNEILRFTEPAYAAAVTLSTPYTLVCRQEFQHPRLGRAERQIELWKTEPRARVTPRFHRLSSESARGVLFRLRGAHRRSHWHCCIGVRAV